MKKLDDSHLERNDGDLFDPQRLRISQNYADLAGVQKVLITVPVRRPRRQEFIRVHSDPEYRLPFLTLELDEGREVYLVEPSLGSELPGEFRNVTLATTITRQGVVLLWPVPLPDPSGKQNSWPESERTAATMAIERWVRVVSNRDLRAYEVLRATGDIPEPEWPKESFRQLLEIAFRDRLIQSTGHPVVQRLLGAK